MGIDIRVFKRDLRLKNRTWRESLTPALKRELDDKIFRKVIKNNAFQRADTVFCFVSTKIEVDTHRLIEYCWKYGKRVALPRCLNDRGMMKFYFVDSWEDVEVGRFSLLEPVLSKCREARPKMQDISIVPGLCFDRMGYRLGFGKGYYDRFLSKNSVIKIGICYNACIEKKLPHGRFDVAVDYLVTDKSCLRIQNRKRIIHRKVEDHYGQRQARTGKKPVRRRGTGTDA